MLVLGLASLRLSSGLLNLPADIAEKVVEYLQDRIFVESRFLVNDPVDHSGKLCDSLSGPHCKVNSATMSGAVPLGFLSTGSISLNDIMAYVPQATWDFNLHTIAPSETKPYASLTLSEDQQVGKPVLSHYSLGLPEGVIAEWDKQWRVDKYHRPSSTSFTPGYIRFSKPVMIRKIWLELTAEDARAIIILRRGSLVVWRSAVLSLNGLAFDACLWGAERHVPLEPVDEIAVVSNAKGFTISSIELFQSSGQLIPVMIFAPVASDVVNIRSVMVDSSLIDMGVLVSMSSAIKAEQHLTRGNITNPNNVMFQIGGELVIPEELRLILKNMNKAYVSKIEDKLFGTKKSETNKKMAEAEAKELEMVDDLFLAVLLHQ
jgi:hypothetical protein